MSRGMTISAGVDFFVEDCSKCGTLFAMTTALNDRKRELGGEFYCPNGHSMVYRDTLKNKLRRAEEKLRQECSVHEDTRSALKTSDARLRATKGVVTRIKRKVGSGQCPCCHQKFKDLADHMSAEHPEWLKQEVNTGAP